VLNGRGKTELVEPIAALTSLISECVTFRELARKSAKRHEHLIEWICALYKRSINQTIVSQTYVDGDVSEGPPLPVTEDVHDKVLACHLLERCTLHTDIHLCLRSDVAEQDTSVKKKIK
jgi:hypothetical protein